MQSHFCWADYYIKHYDIYSCQWLPPVAVRWNLMQSQHWVETNNASWWAVLFYTCRCTAEWVSRALRVVAPQAVLMHPGQAFRIARHSWICAMAHETAAMAQALLASLQHLTVSQTMGNSCALLLEHSLKTRTSPLPRQNWRMASSFWHSTFV